MPGSPYPTPPSWVEADSIRETLLYLFRSIPWSSSGGRPLPRFPARLFSAMVTSCSAKSRAWSSESLAASIASASSGSEKSNSFSLGISVYLEESERIVADSGATERRGEVPFDHVSREGMALPEVTIRREKSPGSLRGSQARRRRPSDSEAAGGAETLVHQGGLRAARLGRAAPRAAAPATPGAATSPDLLPPRVELWVAPRSGARPPPATAACCSLPPSFRTAAETGGRRATSSPSYSGSKARSRPEPASATGGASAAGPPPPPCARARARYSDAPPSCGAGASRRTRNRTAGLPPAYPVGTDDVGY